MGLAHYVTPDAHVESVEQISAAWLKGWGVRGLVLDLDNTLVPWNTADVPGAVGAWVRSLTEAGIASCVLTNNYTRRATEVAELLKIPIIKAAFKPSPAAFRGALRVMTLPADQVAVVGDQLFTDVLGGKLVGMRAILVEPLSAREFFTTKFVRWLERPVRARVAPRRS
jgi:hypothetical protein